MIDPGANVVSEFMRPKPHPDVVTWLDKPHISALFVAAARREP